MWYGSQIGLMDNNDTGDNDVAADNNISDV